MLLVVSLSHFIDSLSLTLSLSLSLSYHPDTGVEKYCILITNLPPSSMTVMESIRFGTMSHFQLAEEMAKVHANIYFNTPGHFQSQ